MNKRKKKKQNLKKDISFIGVLKIPKEDLENIRDISESVKRLNSTGEWIIIPDNYECYITPLYSPKASRIRTITKIIKK